MSIRWRVLVAWIVMTPLLVSSADGKEKKQSSPDTTQFLQVSPGKHSTQNPGKSHSSPDLSRQSIWAPKAKGSLQAPDTLSHESVNPYALHLPPFVLSEIFYYEPGTGTKYQGKRQGSTWRLPVMDTLKNWRMTFIFTSNVPKEEIADIVLKKACCSQLLLSNQSVQIAAMTFSGERVFVVGIVPNMQDWPKSVQLWMYHSGFMATLPDATRAPISVGGVGQPYNVAAAPSSIGGRMGSSGINSQLTNTDNQQGATTAPVMRPAMDYKSVPVSIQSDKVSYFSEVLYPTFTSERCTDCHSMGDRTTVEKQHEAGGVTGVNGTYTHQAGCGNTSCHNFVKDWRTPPFSMGINWKGKSAKEICTIVTGHLPTAGGLHSHFHDDPRVIWAVSDGWVPQRPRLPTAPPHDKQAWFVLVDEWIDGDFPCPE